MSCGIRDDEDEVGVTSATDLPRKGPRRCRCAMGTFAQAMLDAFIILLNVAAFLGYGTIPLDVFLPQRSILVDVLPPGKIPRRAAMDITAAMPDGLGV